MAADANTVSSACCSQAKIWLKLYCCTGHFLPTQPTFSTQATKNAPPRCR